MSELIPFNFNNSSISCTIVDGNPWFQAKEVATILAYTNTKKAIIDHVDDEDKRRREELRGLRVSPRLQRQKRDIHQRARSAQSDHEK